MKLVPCPSKYTAYSGYASGRRQPGVGDVDNSYDKPMVCTKSERRDWGWMATFEREEDVNLPLWKAAQETQQ